MSRALLYSGGFDSACAWWALGKPAALYVGGEYGPARWANAGEVAAIAKQAEMCPEFENAIRCLRFDFRPFMREDEYNFPRDIILCQLAWAQGYSEAMIGWVKDDGGSDDWVRFQSENNTAAVGMKGFSVSFPVQHLTKRELYEAALDAGAPHEFLDASHSCLRGPTPCGECSACKAREGVLVES